LAARFTTVINSDDGAVYSRWFLMASTDPDIPKRSGYVLGLRVVEAVAKDVPVDRLIRLQGPQLRSRIARALQQLTHR